MCPSSNRGKVFKTEFKLFFITNNNLSRFFFVTKDVVKVNDNSLFESSIPTFSKIDLRFFV